MASPSPPCANCRSSSSSVSIPSARARRQAATATWRASTVCSAPTGASSSTSAALRPANSAASSSGSTRCFRARVPSSAHSAPSAPCSVFGPRDFAPFRQLVSARAVVVLTVAQWAAPALDMADSSAVGGCRLEMKAPERRLRKRVVYPLLGILSRQCRTEGGPRTARPRWRINPSLTLTVYQARRARVGIRRRAGRGDGKMRGVRRTGSRLR